MKWIVWLSKKAVSTVLISTLSVFTSWYIVNAYIEDVFQQMNLKVPHNTLQISDFLSTLIKPVNKLLAKDEPSAQSIEQGEQGLVGKDNDNQDQADVSTPSESIGKEVGPFGQDAIAAWNQGSTQQQQDAFTGQKEIVMSAEDFYKKKELLTNEDKMKIFSILVSRLPQEEVQKISLFIENGITQDELKEVENIVTEHLEKEEYEELIAILDKY